MSDDGNVIEFRRERVQIEPKLVLDRIQDDVTGTRLFFRNTRTQEIEEIYADSLPERPDILYAMLPETNHEASFGAGVFRGRREMYPYLSSMRRRIVQMTGRYGFVLLGGFSLGMLSASAIFAVIFVI